jgi:vancomycin permeability regulator SanA
MNNYLVIPPPESFTPVSKLTPESINILKQGLKTWRTGKFSHIIVSGGIVNPRQIQHKPGGIIYQKWLVQHGVPENKILVDTTARDIYESVDRIVELIREDECSITLISNLILFLRICLICKIKHKEKKIKLFCKKIFSQKLVEIFWLINTIIDPYGRGYLASEYRWKRTIL